MKHFTLLLFCIMILTFRAGGQIAGKPSGWYVAPAAVFLSGNNKASGAGFVSGGWQYHRWSLGVGLGLDYYRVRSVPLVGELRYHLLPKQQLYLYAQAGTNRGYAESKQHSSNSSQFRNGLYAGGGAGIYPFRKQMKGWYLFAGYSLKKLTEVYDQYVYYDWGWILKQKRDVYSFKRLAIGIGVWF